jgi:hypothetical protein
MKNSTQPCPAWRFFYLGGSDARIGWVPSRKPEFVNWSCGHAVRRHATPPVLSPVRASASLVLFTNKAANENNSRMTAARHAAVWRVNNGPAATPARKVSAKGS